MKTWMHNSKGMIGFCCPVETQKGSDSKFRWTKAYPYRNDGQASPIEQGIQRQREILQPPTQKYFEQICANEIPSMEFLGVDGIGLGRRGGLLMIRCSSSQKTHASVILSDVITPQPDKGVRQGF